jgi:hypothetical protein
MSKQHVSLYDNQHYIDSQWGGSPEGEPIDCTYLRELTVTVKWKTAATSYGTTVEYSAVQQHGLNGQLVATWRDLPKWCGVRVECVEGTQGEGSALRVAVLGR